MVCKLEVALQISPLCNLRKLRRGFLVIDEVWILWPYGQRVSNSESAELSMGTEKNSDHRSDRAQQRYSCWCRESSFSEGSSGTFFLVGLAGWGVGGFFSGHWFGGFFVLAPLSDCFPYLSLPSWFHNSSTMCQYIKVHHILELSGVIHRKTEQKWWYGIILSSQGHVIRNTSLPASLYQGI